MKYRLGFVSNSSSSSFCVVFKNEKEEGLILSTDIVTNFTDESAKNRELFSRFIGTIIEIKRCARQLGDPDLMKLTQSFELWDPNEGMSLEEL